MAPKRITLSKHDAAHLYELALEHFLVSKKEGICFECLELKKRLEKTIGQKEAKRLQRQTKQHPYCPARSKSKDNPDE
ncbi:MAG TPA: hypothetical protein VMR46_01960 [Candidatus Paceibacterota bacterium]|jgi:hypothetical protein|nr:hypothetical protein [Candidatus Paceibacterota bacterium]